VGEQARGSIAGRRAALSSRFPSWTPMALHQRLDAVAAEHGDRAFVLSDARTYTYADVVEASVRLADGLAALGVRAGDHVGLLMANHPEFIPLKFAISRAGAVAVPLNYLYRREELGYVLAQSECRALVTMTRFGDLDHLGMLDEIAPGWERGAAGGLPELRSTVLLSTDGRTRDGVLTVDQLEDLGARRAGGTATVQVRPDGLGDLLYTSGTTGSPKGVMVTHDMVLRTAFASALTRAFEDGRRILFSLPCYHMFGYVEGLLAAMFVGGAIIPQTAFSPLGYLRGVERHRATEILCVPTMTVALLEHPDRAAYDLSSLFALLSGAAPAPMWLWERARSELGVTEITTGYGMTEAGGAMTLTLPEDPPERLISTVGRIKLAGPAGLPDGALAEYRTVDPVNGDDLPAGTEGELASRGPTSMLGYWMKPAETAQALHGGWLRSGDLGRVLEDGYLQITGRSKELYKSGGELVAPKEIEELLSGHPGVSQVYVVGAPDERWGEVGCAFVVRDPASDVEAEALIALCRARLARFKVPRHIFFVDAADLPLTPTGKVQKFHLARRAGDLLGSG
jgi:fatty-acyl-CoA synthase